MPSIQSDIGAVAIAIKEFFSWLTKHMDGREKRNLKAAARNSQKYMKRVERLFPGSKEDKQLSKYKRNFNKYII